MYVFFLLCCIKAKWQNSQISFFSRLLTIHFYLPLLSAPSSCARTDTRSVGLCPDWTSGVTCLRPDARCVQQRRLWRKASDLTGVLAARRWTKASLSLRMRYSATWRTPSASPSTLVGPRTRKLVPNCSFWYVASFVEQL